jgi:hypothetical protein
MVSGSLIHAAFGRDSAGGLGSPELEGCNNIPSGSIALIAVHPGGSAGGVTVETLKQAAPCQWLIIKHRIQIPCVTVVWVRDGDGRRMRENSGCPQQQCSNSKHCGPLHCIVYITLSLPREDQKGADPDAKKNARAALDATRTDSESAR